MTNVERELCGGWIDAPWRTPKLGGLETALRCPIPGKIRIDAPEK